MINAEFDEFDMIYSNSTESRQKISVSRDEHFCADNYFPELLQRTELCGNDTRVFIIKR